jgi:hypothetical protein
VATNDISPYLQRPVRSLEDAMAEVEQQRLGTPAPVITLVIPASKSDDAASSDAIDKEERD